MVLGHGLSFGTLGDGPLLPHASARARGKAAEPQGTRERVASRRRAKASASRFPAPSWVPRHFSVSSIGGFGGKLRI